MLSGVYRAIEQVAIVVLQVILEMADGPSADQLRQQVVHECTKLMKKIATLTEEFNNFDPSDEVYVPLAKCTVKSLEKANKNVVKAVQRVRNMEKTLSSDDE